MRWLTRYWSGHCRNCGRQRVTDVELGVPPDLRYALPLCWWEDAEHCLWMAGDEFFDYDRATLLDAATAPRTASPTRTTASPRPPATGAGTAIAARPRR